jgi:hypothetical protein
MDTCKAHSVWCRKLYGHEHVRTRLHPFFQIVTLHPFFCASVCIHEDSDTHTVYTDSIAENITTGTWEDIVTGLTEGKNEYFTKVGGQCPCIHAFMHVKCVRMRCIQNAEEHLEALQSKRQTH